MTAASRASTAGPVRLGDCTWSELRTARPVLVVPVGSCEQHGPHLPLDTDTRIAVALADRLAATLTATTRSERSEGSADGAASVARGAPVAVVAPPVAITASGEHAGFAGTLSVGTDVTSALLVELVRSADWADGVVLVNGHGGNAEAVRRAVARSTADGRRVLAWWPRLPDGDAHAGATETSLVLAIAPEVVRWDLAEPGRTEPIRELIDDLRRGGVAAVSPNGVLGDPTTATADAGHALLDRLASDLVAAVDTWRTAART